MSDVHPLAGSHITDRVGLWIQELHASGELSGTQPLLRVDNGDAARRAPFQFDTVTGRLHRTGCRRIPKGSLSAIYGIWQIGKDDQLLACPRCKPMPKIDDQKEDSDNPTDLLYGVLAIVDQFGGVLRERGQEYRNSRVGKQLGAHIENMYRGINEREKNILDVVLTSLDELATTIHELHADLNGANGHRADGEAVEPSRVGAQQPQSNGHDVNHERPGKARRPPKAAQD
jgi:hypothetical protein